MVCIRSDSINVEDDFADFGSSGRDETGGMGVAGTLSELWCVRGHSSFAGFRSALNFCLLEKGH